MSSFDTLLRDAEALSHGHVRVAVSRVNVNHLTRFFTCVASGEVSSIKGKILLAQHEVDDGRAEMLIKEIQDLSVDEVAGKGAGPEVRWRKYRPLTAMEQLERARQEDVAFEWRETVRRTIESLGKKGLARSPVSAGDRLFSHDNSEADDVSSKAQVFAKQMLTGSEVNLSSPLLMIDRCMEALEIEHEPGDRTFSMRMDFFRSLKHIIGRREALVEKLGADGVVGSVELIPQMVQGTLEYLQEQFRRVHFPDGILTTMDQVDAFVVKRFPQCQPPWPHIWFALRAGLYDVVREVCGEYRVTKQFQQAFDAFVIGDEIPAQEQRSIAMMDTAPRNDNERFRLEAYVFVTGFEVEATKHYSCCVNTIEDFLFCACACLRFDNTLLGFGDERSVLNSIDDSALSSDAFKNGDIRFVEPMIHALCLRFDECVKSLLSIKLFPVESLHVMMILKAANLWDGPVLAVNLSDFTQILPKPMLTAAVDYLAFSENRKVLVDFLLHQDVVRTTINLDAKGKEMAIELLREETTEKPFAITTLQLLILCKDYENAVRLFRNIADSPSSFSDFDFVKAVELCSVLVSKMRATETEADVAAVRQAGMRISLFILSCADKLPQSQRNMLVEACRILLLTSDENELADNVHRQAVNTMIRVCRILILFDSGMTDQAMELVSSRPHIIPLSEDDFAYSVDWMNSGILPSMRTVAAVTLRIASFLGLKPKENAHRLEIIAQFAQRIPLTDEDSQRFACLFEKVSKPFSE